MHKIIGWIVVTAIGVALCAGAVAFIGAAPGASGDGQHSTGRRHR